MFPKPKRSCPSSSTWFIVASVLSSVRIIFLWPTSCRTSHRGSVDSDCCRASGHQRTTSCNKTQTSRPCSTATKASLGKLSFDFDLLAIAEKSGFELLDFSASDALLLKDLPFHNRDPFDRMLIAQAKGRDLSIATQDPAFSLYDCRVLP